MALNIVSGANENITRSLDAISQNANTAFSFVDAQRQDVEARLISEIMPWLVGGASIIAITLAYGRK